jgi:prolyl 4-hydroxylase
MARVAIISIISVGVGRVEAVVVIGWVCLWFTWMLVGIRGGGTQFPRFERPEEKEGEGKCCEVVECADEGEVNGEVVVFKPIEGNAVFWVNLWPDGRGYEDVWHAGLPVLKGEKVGFNIWSWGSARR